MTTHLTDAELLDFSQGVLAPDRLLEVDDHLAACDSCRTRAARLTNADARLHGFALETPLVHVDDDEMQQFVRRKLDAPQAAAVRRHLGACAMCAEHVRDLEGWIAAPSARLPRWAAIAAAVLVAALVPLAIWQLKSQRETVPPSVAGLDALPSAVQERVRSTLAGGTLEPPAFMADLAGGRETLMGSPVAPAGGVDVIAPVGTAVASARPHFTWTAASGAGASYVVTIADDRSTVVARSPQLATTSWTPEEELPRGRTYTWQVAVRRGAESFVAPAPPAAPARFHVVDADTSTAIERIERAHPDAHLLLGIVEADAGLRDEAIRHLRQVPPGDRYGAVARRLLDRLTRAAPAPSVRTQPRDTGPRAEVG